MSGRDSRSSPGRPSTRARAAAVAAANAHWGLPLDAERRLNEIAGGQAPFNAPGRLGAFALSQAAGLQSLGSVFGAQVGSDLSSYGVGSGYVKPGEFRGFAGGHASQWLTLAADHMRMQAAALGATVVVDVTLSRLPLDWLEAPIFNHELAGTALLDPAAPPGGAPVLTNLSAADYWALRQVGARPLGLCSATCLLIGAMTPETVRVARSGVHPRRRRLLGRRVAPSQPLPDLSRAVKAARDQAVAELERQARALGARGIVNLDLKLDVRRAVSTRVLRNYGSRYWLLSRALATAISSRSGAKLDPRPIVSWEGARP